MKDWIKRALTKTIMPKGRGKPTIIEPNPKLVYAVKFSITMTMCLSALEIAYMLILNQWNSTIS